MARIGYNARANEEGSWEYLLGKEDSANREWRLARQDTRRKDGRQSLWLPGGFLVLSGTKYGVLGTKYWVLIFVEVKARTQHNVESLLDMGAGLNLGISSLVPLLWKAHVKNVKDLASISSQAFPAQHLSSLHIGTCDLHACTWVSVLENLAVDP